eukprot:GEMP01007382.1.p1 GENE.GEMP01007382.1~~GEMP01007382.1.p1  ORF type:complete len:473 (+),score=123.93 GEMP01007382.1:42-1460(+)
MEATKNDQYVVIVDPYSSGMYLVQEFQTQQFPMIGIQSSQHLAEFWLEQYDESLFAKNIKHESLEMTVAQLKEFNVIAILAGSEPGVQVAEELQSAMGVLGNDAKTTHLRRHKYNMQERLREVGLRAVRQIFAATPEECLAWQKQWNKWPIIIKPAMSGGTDGVYWCHTEDDCRLAFDKECGKLNVNGELNDKLLCQEFLDGKEYVIDCVSYEMKHVLSCMWVYEKHKIPEGNAIVYQYARAIECRGEIQDKLVDYVFQVLDALQIRYGPSHTEVIVVDGEPCLVETGARMHGMKGPKLTEFATGLGTHKLVADVFVHGARIFNDLRRFDYRYILKQYVFESFLHNWNAEGNLSKDVDVDKLKQLQSVVDARASVRKGEYLRKTRDLATSPGYFLQVHQSLEQCFADLKSVRRLEASGEFYVVDPNSPVLKDCGRREMSVMCSSPRKTFAPSPIALEDDFAEEMEFCLEMLA